MRAWFRLIVVFALFIVALFIEAHTSNAADVKIQDTDSGFVYYNGVTSSTDGSTADNSSARMMNDSQYWNITYLKTDMSDLKAGVSYDVFFRVKVDHTGSNPGGSAFKMAVWDNTYGAYVLPEKHVEAAQTQDMVWKEYKVGTFKPNSGVNQLVFYVAGVNNAAQVSDIYVDYITFKEHTTYTIQDTDFSLYLDSIGASVADGLPGDNSAAVLFNGPVPEWTVQAPIDSSNIEADVPYKIGLVVYPQFADLDTSSGDVFGYLVYNNTTSSFAVPPTVVKSTDWPVNLKFPIYYEVMTPIVTLNPAHTYHIAFFKVNNATNFPSVRIDKVYVEKANIDDNPSQSISIYPYKMSPANQDGLNDTSAITYTLPAAQTVSVKVYNTVNNSLVRTLVTGASQSGTQTVEWDGKNSAGQIVPNGLYVVKVANGTTDIFKKNVQVISGVTLFSPPANTANTFVPRMVWFAGELVPYHTPAAATYINTAFAEIKNMNADTVAMVNMSRKTPADYAMYLDKAAENDLKVIAMPDPETAYRNESLANDEVAMYNYLTELIAPIRNKSALLNYYLRDEPEVDVRTAENLKNMKRMLETIDPNHPVSIVYNYIEGVSMHYSAQQTHALLSDIYPAWENVAAGNFKTGAWDFTEQMDYFNLQIRKDIANPAPYWSILQNFGGTGVGWRVPTPAELRAMTYLSIGHNSKGIGYFIYQSQQGWKGLVDEELNHTANYTASQALFGEIATMESTIKNMIRIGNVASTSGGGLIVGDNTIYSSADVTTHVDKVTGDKYLVVVNRDSSNYQNVTITINRAELGMDISEIYNVYDNSPLVYHSDSSSYTISNLNFSPGAGKIIKLVKSAAAYSGQDELFTLQNGAMKGNEDVTASDSKTAMKIVQNTNGRDIKWYWNKANVSAGVTYDLYAKVKIRYANDTIAVWPYGSPPSQPSGNAFEAGIYDETAASQIGSPVTVSAASMENMLWHTVKVGTFTPSQTHSQYVYVTPANNMSNVYAVYVDEFYFLPVKTATASSSFEGFGWGTAKAVDGARSSDASSYGWSSNSNLTMNHTEWINVDLGTGRTINRVDLYPRNDGTNIGAGFPENFTIQVSADNVNWTTVVTRTGYAVPGNAVQTFAFASQNARYVKIEGTKLRTIPNEGLIYRMQFAEIEVY
ncbi:discoidin domain-containing protein [Paenibacillus sp. J5C_2022]|uniref:discoidin domain-containing protein n=1 Tax=Paenibacillus sp. J5C2022 TaxID=2977129 RepID=UPI0021D0DEA0|nr:discoidin domain-containing protein [Paenibacillus sp. J5C2022]MCU6711276.1 discoidin domain-containing protein [Paenibacillus sp. J5C2022]